MRKEILILLFLFLIYCHPTNSENFQNTSPLEEMSDTRYQIPKYLKDTIIVKCNFNENTSYLIVKLNDSTIKLIRYWCITGGIREEAYYINGLKDSIFKEYYMDGYIRYWRRYEKGIEMHEGEDYIQGNNILTAKYYMIDTLRIFEYYFRDGTLNTRDTIPFNAIDSLYAIYSGIDTLILEDIVYENNDKM